jgi:YD repeat-containing protein
MPGEELIAKVIPEGDCASLDDGEVFSDVCKVDLPALPLGKNKVKVVLTACSDSNAQASEEAPHPPPPDLGPLGAPVTDDDPGENPGGSPGKPNSCEQEPKVGSNSVRLTNGNMRYSDRDVLPAYHGSLAVRVNDSSNDATGLFGKGWFSGFDSRVIVDGSKYHIVTEENIVVLFEESSGTFTQTWPTSNFLGTLTSDGSTYVYTQGNIIRSYSVATGRLISYGFHGNAEKTILTYDASGLPTSAYGSIDGTTTWSWTIACNAAGKIETISTSNATWSYYYSGSLLDYVTIDGSTWRTYQYDTSSPGNEKLEEIRDAGGYLIERYQYYPETDPSYPGWAMTSESPNESIISIEYRIDESQLDRPLNKDALEYATRVTWASGQYSDYYIRPIAGNPHRTVEIHGSCNCSGSGELTVLAYDSQGRLVRRQDGRGYITRWTYDGLSRVTSRTDGLQPQGCDPATASDYCRVASTDDLLTLSLDESAAVTTDYSYDTTWLDKISTVCRASVVESGQTTCDTFTYDSVTGKALQTGLTGWTWESGITVQKTALMTSTYYGQSESAVFNPATAAATLGVTIVFDTAWASLPQPEAKLKEVDGPLTGNTDRTQYVYYPVDSSVPPSLQGRVAATRNPTDDVTFFDGYDQLGNVTRTIDQRGVATSYTYDALGNLTEVTLEGQPGCDTVADPLCDDDLTTQYLYQDGRFDTSITPLGHRQVTTLRDIWGRGAMSERYDASDLVNALERRELILDPSTGAVLEEMFKSPDGLGGWTEDMSRELVIDGWGRLFQTVDPDTGAIEQYGYDPIGNMISYQDQNHDAANVRYEYDNLGRMLRLKQLESPPDDDGWIVTEYGYDLHGNLTSVTDANGDTTSYEVDDFGHTCSITSPVTGTTTMSYDLAGKLVGKTYTIDAVAPVIVTETRSYSDAGRIEALDWSDGIQTTQQVTFGYTSDSKTATTVDSFGDTVEESWTYDRRGLILSYMRSLPNIANASKVISFAYNEDGTLTSQSIDGYTVTYEPDHAGRPTEILLGSTTLAQSIKYKAYGPAYEMTRGMVTETFGFDKSYRLT